MNDLKSKLPDLKEITSMTGKLFKDVKNSVGEIIQEYKQKREQAPSESSAKKEAPTAKTTKKETKTTEPKAKTEKTNKEK